MNNKERLFKIGGLIGIMVFIFLIAISIKEFKSISYVGKDSQIINTISVSGTGETFSIPDIATFSFSVTENAKTVADAQTQATTKINNALKSIKDAGVVDKDIKTISYTIEPHYDYTGGVCTQSYPSTCTPSKSVLTGYDVSQSIEVKVRDLSKAGELFGTIASAGVKNLNDLAFSIDNIDSVKAVARTLAITDAKTKAEKIASDLGVSLVKVTSFYDSSENQPVYAPVGASSVNVMSAKVSSAPEIPQGEQKVTANVTITYEIK